jgi:hypothetical protein
MEAVLKTPTNHLRTELASMLEMTTSDMMLPQPVAMLLLRDRSPDLGHKAWLMLSRLVDLLLVKGTPAEERGVSPDQDSTVHMDLHR